jgi:hypothetical protein
MSSNIICGCGSGFASEECCGSEWWQGRRALLLLQSWVHGCAPDTLTLKEIQYAAHAALVEYDGASDMRDLVRKAERHAEMWMKRAETAEAAVRKMIAEREAGKRLIASMPDEVRDAMVDFLLINGLSDRDPTGLFPAAKEA